MDNHPIPQDVTNFQFHLVGDLTLKQFGYLIASVIIAWLMYILPIFFIIKFFFSLVFLGIGIILAFVPLEGRPSDEMFIHFFKALFIPNQYTYQVAPAIVPIQTPPQMQSQPLPPIDQIPEDPQTVMLTQTAPIHTPLVQQPPIPPMVNPLPPKPEAKPQDEASIENKEHVLEEELQKAKTQEAVLRSGTQEAVEAHQKVQQLETQMRDLASQKQDLEKQILDLQQLIAQKNQQDKSTVFTPGTAVAEPKETPHVLKVSKQLGKSVGLPIAPDFPNLLTGIVKDSRGNVLPNILIEVKDKEGNAVRAFKTNNLGQFASATPLLSGVYTVSFEDTSGKQQFDMVQIEAIGEIISPIEVISVDKREQLRQELFGK